MAKKKFNARDSVPRKKTRKKTRASKMGSLARDSFISNYTNTASHLPIWFIYLFFLARFW